MHVTKFVFVSGFGGTGVCCLGGALWRLNLHVGIHE